jgi:N-methylhydantoinase A/oxoprolinase/acetone carboxylase beta subunit
MAAVIVPPRAGVLSAAGILAAPVARELVHTWRGGNVDEFAARLADEARRLVGPTARVEVAYDCRYRGQSHELTVPSVDAFEDEHRRVNGHVRHGDAIEVVAVRARAEIASPVQVLDLPVAAARARAVGPSVIAEADCTIWVPEGWQATVGHAGALVLRRTP